jgi:hypothetical protein
MFAEFVRKCGKSGKAVGLACGLGLAPIQPLSALDTLLPAREWQGGEKEFAVYDGTSFLHKPNLESYGFKPIHIVYAGEFWDPGENREALPRELRLALLAKQAAEEFSPTVLDIEHWPLRQVSNEEVGASLEKYVAVLAGFRKAAPKAKLGYYGMAPIRDYWRAIQGPGSPEYRQWQAENDKLQPLADQVDILFPSIYTFYTDQKGWENYAVAQIREARRLARGKPVYAFLWPNYHESNKVMGGTALPEEFWRFQLEIMRRHADGVVVWDGARTPWSDANPWWKVTQKFMEESK